MPEKLLTTKEVAEYLGISEKEVEGLVAKGKLTAYKIGETFLRFRQEHVDVLRNKISTPKIHKNANFFESLVDFLYFSDFYIISILLIILLIAIVIYF